MAQRASLERILAQLPGAVYVGSIAPDGSVSFPFASDSVLARELGIRPSDIEADPTVSLRLMDAEGIEAVAQAVRRTIETLEPQSIDCRIRTPEGRARWLRATSAPERQADGSIRCTGMIIDITEQKNEEEACRAAFERLRGIYEFSHDAMGYAALDGTFLDGNAAMLQLIGYEAHELIGRKKYQDVTPVEHQARENEIVREMLATGRPAEYEKEFLRKDGARVPVALTVFLIRDAGGTPVGTGAIIKDITARKVAEAERAHYAEQLQRLASAAPVLNAGLSVDDLVRCVTEEARAIIGAHQAVTSFTVNENWAQAIRHVSQSDKYAAYRSYAVEPDGSGIYAVVCRTNRPLRLTQPELEAHPAWRAFGGDTRHPPLRGWLAAPLIGGDGSNIGLIQLSDKYQGEFTAGDEAIVVQLAQMTAQAIENSRLFEQVRSAHERLQTLSRRLVEVQERERRHIARELHDEIAQVLTALNISLERSVQGRTNREDLQQPREMVRTLIERVRDMSLNLRPTMLDDLGLVATLVWHCDRYTAHTGVRVDLRREIEEEVRFSSAVETAAYRIVQEALTNVARHSRSRRARVRLAVECGELRMSIEDHGVGFDSSPPAAGSGISGMQERALLLGGRLSIHSQPGRGTRIRAVLPLGPSRTSHPSKAGA